MLRSRGYPDLLIASIKRLKMGYVAASVANALIIVWLALCGFAPSEYYISEYPNTLFILILAFAIGLALALYQVSSFTKLANLNGRYRHGGAGIVLLVITWALATASAVTNYLATVFPEYIFYLYSVQSIINPTLVKVSLTAALSSIITLFQATPLLTITLYRLGSDLKRPIIKAGAVTLMIASSGLLLVMLLVIIAVMAPRPMTSLALPYIIFIVSSPILGLAGTVLLAIGLSHSLGQLIKREVW